MPIALMGLWQRRGGIPAEGEFGALPLALSSVLQTPAAPVTTSTHTPTTLAALNAALQIDGARVTVNSLAESTGTILIDADDVVLEINTDLSGLVLNLAQNIHRVRVIGGEVSRIAFQPPSYYDDGLEQQVFEASRFATDISFVGVTADSPDDSACLIYGRRVSIYNCYLRGNQYGIYVAAPGAAGGIFNEDITVTGGTVIGLGQASFRILQTHRTVTDSAQIGGVGSTRHGWRIHQGTTLAFCGRCTLSPGGIMLSDPAEPTDTGLGEFWFEDNRVEYTLANGVIITLDPYTRFTAGTIKNNVFVMAGASVFSDIWSYGAVPGDWDLTGNTIEAP